MPNQSNDATRELQAVLDALQKSLLDASAEDLMKELRAAGVDPLKAKEVMKFAEEKGIDDHFRKVREKLALERNHALRNVNSAAGRLPASRAERLDLLKSVFAQHSQLQPLTAQFRNFTNPDELSDAEISSMLQNLIALGYVDLPNGTGG